MDARRTKMRKIKSQTRQQSERDQSQRSWEEKSVVDVAESRKLHGKTAQLEMFSVGAVRRSFLLEFVGSAQQPNYRRSQNPKMTQTGRMMDF
jgi:hypothetical protein